MPRSAQVLIFVGGGSMDYRFIYGALGVMLVVGHVVLVPAGGGRKTFLNSLNMSALLQSAKSTPRDRADSLLKSLQTLNEVIVSNPVVSSSDLNMFKEDLETLVHTRNGLPRSNSLQEKLAEIDELIELCSTRINNGAKYIYGKEPSFPFDPSKVKALMSRDTVSVDELSALLTKFYEVLKSHNFTATVWPICNDILADFLAVRSRVPHDFDNTRPVLEIDLLLQTCAQHILNLMKDFEDYIDER